MPQPQLHLMLRCAEPVRRYSLEVVSLPFLFRRLRGGSLELGVEGLPALRPQMKPPLRVRGRADVADLRLERLKLSAPLWHKHADWFIDLEGHRVFRTGQLPVHGERRYRPIGFDD